MYKLALIARGHHLQSWIVYFFRSAWLVFCWPFKVWWLSLIFLLGVYPITLWQLDWSGTATLLLLFELYAFPLAFWVWYTFWPYSFRDKYAYPKLNRKNIEAIHKEWPQISRAVGLSYLEKRPPLKVKDVPINRDFWIDPVLQKVVIEPQRVDYVISSRPGQTAHDIQTAGEQIAAITQAHHWDSEILAPNAIRMTLFFADSLSGVRNSIAPPENYYGGLIIGRSEREEEVFLDVSESVHTAVQGVTRSGKSALMYGILSGLSYRDDVLICGVDPTGVLLSPFTSGRGAAWIHNGTKDMEHAAAVLENIVEAMDSRIALLNHYRIDKLDQFTPKMPLIMVVLEEYPGLISTAKSDDDASGRRTGDRIRPKIERSIGRLLKEGAKVGIRVIVLAQRMSAEAIDTDSRAQLGRKISLRVDNPDSIRMLHQQASPELVGKIYEFPPGRAVMEAPGMKLTKIQADNTEYSTYIQRVEEGIASSERTNSMHAQLKVSKPETTPSSTSESDKPETVPGEKRPRRKRREKVS